MARAWGRVHGCVQPWPRPIFFKRTCELFQLEIFPRYIWGAKYLLLYPLYSSTVRLYLVGDPVSVRQMLL